MSESIWKTRVDNKYDVEVSRLDEYNGLLKLVDSGKIIMSWPVSLMYGAIFGPDVCDVAEWQNTVINYIDNELNN